MITYETIVQYVRDLVHAPHSRVLYLGCEYTPLVSMTTLVRTSECGYPEIKLWVDRGNAPSTWYLRVNRFGVKVRLDPESMCATMRIPINAVFDALGMPQRIQGKRPRVVVTAGTETLPYEAPYIISLPRHIRELGVFEPTDRGAT